MPFDLGEEAQPKILDDVGVLVFVDQNIAKPALEALEDVAVLAEEPQRFEQEVAEIDGVQRLEAGLVGCVERRAATAGEGGRLALRRVLRIEPPVLPTIDESSQCARRPALVVEVLRLQDLLQQSELVVGVEDGEVRAEADQLGVHAQDLDADRMERAHPRHPLRGPGEEAHPFPHLARGLVGEGDRQNLVGARPARRDQMSDARREHAGFADAGAGENQHRPLDLLDRATLLLVESLQIGRKAARARMAGALARRVRRRERRGGFGSVRHGANHAPAPCRAQSALSTLLASPAQPAAESLTKHAPPRRPPDLGGRT